MNEGGCRVRGDRERVEHRRHADRRGLTFEDLALLQKLSRASVFPFYIKADNFECISIGSVSVL